MTVAENLFFHGRYFGMSGKEAKAADRRAARTRCASPTGPTRR